MKNTLVGLIAFSSTALLVACDNSDSNYSTTTEVKDNHIVNAYQAYSDSLATAEKLQQSIKVFVAAPTEANLTLAKAAYKDTRAPYQQSEIMRWDSAITAGKNLDADGGPASVDDWEGQVNAWPLDENHIVTLIQGAETINTQLLLDQNGVDSSGAENEANVTTGVHAIEFMLWGEDKNGTNPGAGMRLASDYDVANCPDSYCQRRADFLTVAVDLLVADLTEMKAEWSPEAVNTAGTLAHNFKNSDEALDYILTSLSQMSVGELAGARMGSGIDKGDPEESHDCFSDYSHIAIYNNFQGIKNAFYGQYGLNSGASFGQIINQLDPATFERIDDALESIEANMFAILEAGERETNTIRFDQIIGQAETGKEHMITVAAINELTALEIEFKAVKELLSLEVADTDGSGD